MSGSDSDSLLLLDDGEGDVSELSTFWLSNLVEIAFVPEPVSESESESLEDDPEDDVSSLLSSSEEVKELDSEARDKSYETVSYCKATYPGAWRILHRSSLYH